MRHELTLTGHAFRLRPVGDADAAFIVELRNDPTLGRFVHGGAVNVDEQVAWLADYYERADDYYFVVERYHNKRAEGVVALYDLDAAQKRAEWGRWILRSGSPAAVESALLVYRAAFELLGLTAVYCRTVADNTAVISFHDSCGVSRIRTLERHFDIRGHQRDAVEHSLELAEWPPIRARLEHLSRAIAEKVARG